MKMIVPKILEYADFSTNLNDSTESEYDYTGVTAYVTDDIVKVSFESDGTTRIFPEKLYKALAGSTDEYPPDSSNWSSQGAVNRHKMFDQYINTQAVADGTESTDAGDVVFTVNSSRCNGIALFGVEGTSVKYEMKNSIGTIIDTYTDTSLGMRSVSTWSGFFFDDFPSYNDIIYYFTTLLVSTVTVTIYDTGTTYPKCGACVVGQTVDCGKSQWGATPGYMDFSKVTRDSYGNVSASQGNYAKLINVPVRIEKEYLDTVQNAAINVRGIPTVFDGNNDDTTYKCLFVLGLLTDFRPVMESYNNFECTFKIEGLV